MNEMINNTQILKQLEDYRILPMFTVDKVEDVELVRLALKGADILMVEVVLRSETAMQAIKLLSQDQDLIVGAGTVRTVEQAQAALDNGARFIVVPAIVPAVLEFCQKNNVICFPGITTPSEIEHALTLGAEVFKFFPAGAYGGVNTLKAFAGPYPDYKFIPTGGVNEDNYLEYLQQKNVMAVGGSFILPSSLIKTKDLQALTAYLLKIKKIK